MIKKVLEKAFIVSLIFGVIATILCIASGNNPYIIIVALCAGFFGFVLSCLHIIAVQRYGIKQAAVPLLLLCLLLNSAPLIYMITIVTKSKG